MTLTQHLSCESVVMQLSFIILSWNSENYLRDCFESILSKCNAEDVAFEVIVIDNGSQDRSAEIIKDYSQAHPGSFMLIQLTANRGTTFPRNLGLKQAKGEYVCIIDSDTELGEGRLAEILDRLDKHQSIGLIAPRLLLPGGIVQNSVKHFPTMLNKLLKIPRILLGIKTRNADFYADFPFSEERQVESAISACWFFRKALLDQVGLLDERIFYAPEDVEFSLRVWKAGYAVLYYPGFTVLHHTQQITHKKPLSKTSLSHFWGLLYYYRKHGGWLTRPKFAPAD